MRSLCTLVLAAAAGLGLWPAVLGAAALDGSVPMLCAFTSVVECGPGGECHRRTPQDADVPAFIRVDVPQRLLSSTEGARSSPIATVQRADGRLMLQGAQNGRVWGAVIDERTGQMSAAIGEADGAFVLSGVCVIP